MGADYIGYIVVGPNRPFTEEEIERAVGVYKTVEQETVCPECEERVTDGVCEGCGRDYPKPDMDLDEFRDFLTAWPLNYRDVGRRDYKGNLLLCAGERTWGDEPGGKGYQWLKRVMSWGLGEALGLE
jgi:hypothetical protein